MTTIAPACCAAMFDDIMDGNFVWVKTRQAYARMDVPKRKVSWKVAQRVPSAIMADGIPYTFTCCPHCGQDIPPKP